MDRINNETMMGFLRKYSGYQFIEMLVVIVVSAFQVHLVKNMFQTDSILWLFLNVYIRYFNIICKLDKKQN